MRYKEEHLHFHGHIIEIDQDTVFCYIINTHKTNEEYQVEFSRLKFINLVCSEAKDFKLEKDYYFTWAIGWQRKGGKLQRYSKIKFKRRKKLTYKQIKRAYSEAKAIASALKWCE